MIHFKLGHKEDNIYDILRKLTLLVEADVPKELKPAIEFMMKAGYLPSEVDMQRAADLLYEYQQIVVYIEHIKKTIGNVDYLRKLPRA